MIHLGHFKKIKKSAVLEALMERKCAWEALHCYLTAKRKKGDVHLKYYVL